MKFEVTILGNSSATPIFSRNPTSQILNINESLLMIDCGEGTQQQMLLYEIKYNRISDIFISHLHGDHFFGLIGLMFRYRLSYVDLTLGLVIVVFFMGFLLFL